jgi:uncharacterized membrane protein (UPF0127 family)
MNKIRPAHKSRIIWLISLGLGLLILGLIWYQQVAEAPGGELRFVRASIDDYKFNLEVADTPHSRTKGVAGKKAINPGEGMLFVFDFADIECFWMKDVTFNIDILWFDSSNRLIYSKSNVSPDTFPESFCPPEKSKYVVELPSGTAAKLQLDKGDVLDIENL